MERRNSFVFVFVVRISVILQLNFTQTQKYPNSYIKLCALFQQHEARENLLLRRLFPPQHNSLTISPSSSSFASHLLEDKRTLSLKQLSIIKDAISLSISLTYVCTKRIHCNAIPCSKQFSMYCHTTTKLFSDYWGKRLRAALAYNLQEANTPLVSGIKMERLRPILLFSRVPCNGRLSSFTSNFLLFHVNVQLTQPTVC